jgi:hypothetical protein
LKPQNSGTLGGFIKSDFSVIGIKILLLSGLETNGTSTHPVKIKIKEVSSNEMGFK